MSNIDRRSFLKLGGLLSAGIAIAPGITLITTKASAHGNIEASSSNRWGMVIDTNKCTSSCTSCVSACHKENNVPRYGKDSGKVENNWIKKVELKKDGQEKSLPVLCNHCEHPPCHHVCPVEATFKRKDGIVLVDKHRCIGCRYCIMACPYEARSLVFQENESWSNKKNTKTGKGVVESCTLCVHRIDEGKIPACVESCASDGHGAMIFGNLNDPDSEISRYLAKHNVTALREDLELQPKVYYNGI